jgi:hypothetical protein
VQLFYRLPPPVLLHHVVLLSFVRCGCEVKCERIEEEWMHWELRLRWIPFLLSEKTWRNNRSLSSVRVRSASANYLIRPEISVQYGLKFTNIQSEFWSLVSALCDYWLLFRLSTHFDKLLLLGTMEVKMSKGIFSRSWAGPNVGRKRTVLETLANVRRLRN